MQTQQQLALDFTSPSPINVERFSRQNKIVAERLLSGKSITVLIAINEYGIFHLHSRIAECRKEFKRHGIVIYSRMVTVDEIQCKEYSLNPFDNA